MTGELARGLGTRLRGSNHAVRQALGLAMFTGVGAGLNALKFVLLPVVLSARGLDVLSIGLLIAVTCSQIGGEAIANFAVTSSGPAAGRRATVGLLVILLAGAVEPAAITGVLAPERSLSGGELVSMRLFCLSGAASVALWRSAGLAQRRLDFAGFKLVMVMPNLGIILGAVIPARDHVRTIAATSLVAVALAAVYAARRASGRPSVLDDTRRRPGGPRSLGGLLVLSVTTYLNVLLLRVVGAGLPAGSIGAIYISIGVVQLPVTLIAGAAAATLLPRWVNAGATGRDRVPIALVAAVSAAAGAMMCVMLGALALAQGTIRAAIDPAVYHAMRTALPILAAGVPLYSAAWMLRSYAIALGTVRPLIVGTILGALCVPVGWSISRSTAGLTTSFALGYLAWLAAFGVMLWRHRRRARAPSGGPPVAGRSEAGSPAGLPGAAVNR